MVPKIWIEDLFVAVIAMDARCTLGRDCAKFANYLMVKRIGMVDGVVVAA
jgi:hypothetical protein